MKMINTMIFATLTALALSAPYAIAETAAKTDKKSVVSDAETDKLYGAMQERYKKMQEQMGKIRQTKDPKERQKLLQEHWHQWAVISKFGLLARFLPVNMSPSVLSPSPEVFLDRRRGDQAFLPGIT